MSTSSQLREAHACCNLREQIEDAKTGDHAVVDLGHQLALGRVLQGRDVQVIFELRLAIDILCGVGVHIFLWVTGRILASWLRM